MTEKTDKGEKVYDLNDPSVNTDPEEKERMDPMVKKTVVFSVNEIGLVSDAKLVEPLELTPAAFTPDNLNVEFQKILRITP